MPTPSIAFPPASALSPSGIDAVGVGIPARDEQAMVAGCVSSVLRSALRVDLPVVVVVAADRCTDATVRHAQAAIDRLDQQGIVTGSVLNGAHASVGRARATALDAALAQLPAAPERCWLATTDADTVVAEDWLEAQLRWAHQGADGVAGLVEVDWVEGPVSLPRRHSERIAVHGTSYGHRHVHGANLGVRAHLWVQVGGCGAGSVGEDQELWRRLRAVGAQLYGVDDVRVRTSGRLVGRTRRGFSHYLAELAGAESRPGNSRWPGGGDLIEEEF